MAICNLFRKLYKETGNFLMFSQYSNDLTREFVQHEAYRVVPSKFITFDIDYSNFLKTDFKKELNSDDLNVLIPNYLQNYFENGVSFLSSNNEIDFKPSTTTNLFWNAMFRANLLHVSRYDRSWGSKNDSKVEEAYNIIQEMKYVGTIDIHSYEETGGIGFGETYCYIPNDAKETLYRVDCTDSEQGGLYVKYDKDCIEGFEDYNDGSTLPGMLQVKTPYDIYYYYNSNYIFNGSPGNSDAELEERIAYDYKLHYDDIRDTAEKSFKFNTIVVLYDIKTQNSDGSWNTIYTDIPMGIYITGLINNDGTVGNTVNKYEEVQDAYTSGTSYGLRICTRFMVTPNATLIESISVDPEEQYSGFSQAMNKMAESQAKMDNLLTQVVGDSQDIKDHLAQFKNNRTNVPYLRKIGAKYYWFVNGRNTGVTNTGEEDAIDASTDSTEDILNSEKTKITIENGLVIVTDAETGDQYIIDGARKRVQPTAPIFSKGSGTYNKSLPLTISCKTTGVTIYYTLDGTDPKSSSTRISGTNKITMTLFQQTNNETATYTVKAVTYKDGLYSSDVVEMNYSIKRQVENPEINIGGSDYDDERTITISCNTPGSTIWYSIDGGSNYVKYKSGITIGDTLSAGTLKTYATLTGWVNSDVYTYSYDIKTDNLVMYYGLLKDTDTTPETDSELVNLIQLKANTLPQTIKFDADAGMSKVCFAYPKTLGKLTSIKDNNNMDNITGFQIVDKESNKYYIYIMYSEADQSYMNYTFSN